MKILLLDRLQLRGREHVRVKQVLAAPGRYFAVLAAGEEFMS
jgi:hypothetical protein